MQKDVKFNYIITIHNKEDMIEQVLKNVLMCCRDNSHVYPVLDGCTDDTEKIIDKMIDTFAGIPVTKVYTPDVHELKSINAGLRAADHDGDGFNIILQDDVLLADFMLEKKVRRLYEITPGLGYLSFRLGANFKADTLSSNEAVPYDSYIENVYGHGLDCADSLMPGYLAYRTVPIKSPVCIPFKLIREVGMYDERLAPYGHDDPDFAIRSMKAGFKSAVFGIRFYSEIKWGGTRTTPHPELNKIIARNMDKLRDWHRNDLEDICSSPQPEDLIGIEEMIDEEENKKAIEVWHENIERLKRFSRLGLKGRIHGLLAVIKKAVKHYS